MLYQRIKEVAAKFTGSQQALGEALGISGRTFQGYLTPRRENNLWPYLAQILRLHPQLSRDWLYFGEGEMLISEEGRAKRGNIDKADLLIDNSIQAPDINEDILFSVVEALEEVLLEQHKVLDPQDKAAAVCKLYRLVSLDRSARSRPAVFLRYIREALTDENREGTP